MARQWIYQAQGKLLPIESKAREWGAKTCLR